VALHVGDQERGRPQAEAVAPVAILAENGLQGRAVLPCQLERGLHFRGQVSRRRPFRRAGFRRTQLAAPAAEGAGPGAGFPILLPQSAGARARRMLRGRHRGTPALRGGSDRPRIALPRPQGNAPRGPRGPGRDHMPVSRMKSLLSWNRRPTAGILSCPRRIRRPAPQGGEQDDAANRLRRQERSCAGPGRPGPQERSPAHACGLPVAGCLPAIDYLKRFFTLPHVSVSLGDTPAMM